MTRIHGANTLIDEIGQIQNNGVRARSRKEFLISQRCRCVLSRASRPQRFISTLLPYTKLNVFIQQREISIKFLRTRKTKSNLYRCVSRVFPAASQNRRTLYINKKAARRPRRSFRWKSAWAKYSRRSHQSSKSDKPVECMQNS